MSWAGLNLESSSPRLRSPATTNSVYSGSPRALLLRARGRARALSSARTCEGARVQGHGQGRAGSSTFHIKNQEFSDSDTTHNATTRPLTNNAKYFLAR